MAAGLSTRLDQFGVSHTSQQGYLPFSEVQRGDNMKESSHLIKGKRKKAMGTKRTKQGATLKGAMLSSPTTPSLPHTHIPSFIHSQQAVRECLQSYLKPHRGREMTVKHDRVPAPKLLTDKHQDTSVRKAAEDKNNRAWDRSSGQGEGCWLTPGGGLA